MAPLIELKNISKSFGSQKVLDNVNLEIFEGEITTIIGKSGVGKSVLLKHIIGLLKPDKGEIFFKGRPLNGMNKKERSRIKRNFSYMFQNNALFDSMTVFENIALPLVETTRLKKKEIAERVLSKIAQLDLKGTEDQYPSQLSGGMNKRVALARALVTDPKIVLFDEPTTGLDPIRKNSVHDMISEYQKRFGFTGIIVSHEIPDIFYISQRIAMIEDGRIIFQGSPDEITRSKDPLVLRFIHGLEERKERSAGYPATKKLDERFKEEMVRLERYDTEFTLLLLTLENIDEIIKKAGPATAYMAVENLVEKIRSSIRVTDSCARFKTDQIVVILSNTDFKNATWFCKKLSEKIKKSDILPASPYPGFCFSITAGYLQVKKGEQFPDVIETAALEKKPFCDIMIC